MALKFKDFCFDLCDNVIAYVKDKGTNLNILINALPNIVSSVSLMLPQPYVGNCYGHVMSKCYQYATYDVKVCGSMRKVSIKDAQIFLWKSSLHRQKKLKGCKNGKKITKMHLFTFKS